LNGSREMDVVPLPLVQALGHDRGQESSHRAVVEDLGRFPLLQLQVHLDAVPLVGPEEFPGDVEGERRFEGICGYESRIVEGQQLAEVYFGNARLTLKGDRFQMTDPWVTNRGTFMVASTIRPKTIEVILPRDEMPDLEESVRPRSLYCSDLPA